MKFKLQNNSMGGMLLLLWCGFVMKKNSHLGCTKYVQSSCFFLVFPPQKSTKVFFVGWPIPTGERANDSRIVMKLLSCCVCGRGLNDFRGWATAKREMGKTFRKIYIFNSICLPPDLSFCTLIATQLIFNLCWRFFPLTPLFLTEKVLLLSSHLIVG